MDLVYAFFLSLKVGVLLAFAFILYLLAITVILPLYNRWYYSRFKNVWM